MTTTTYDPEADALSVQLAPPGTEVATTEEVAPGVILDVHANGLLVAIKILSVRKRVAVDHAASATGRR